MEEAGGKKKNPNHWSWPLPTLFPSTLWIHTPASLHPRPACHPPAGPWSHRGETEFKSRLAYSSKPCSFLRVTSIL
jgi:hypothetical protein